jgi:hypothetical protein
MAWPPHGCDDCRTELGACRVSIAAIQPGGADISPQRKMGPSPLMLRSKLAGTGEEGLVRHGTCRPEFKTLLLSLVLTVQGTSDNIA